MPILPRWGWAALAALVLVVALARWQYALGACDMADNLAHLVAPKAQCVQAIMLSGDAY